MPKVKGLFKYGVLFLAGFGVIYFGPLGLALNSRAVLMNQYNDAFEDEFDCLNSPDEEPPNMDPRCEGFFNAVIGGGHKDGNGGVSLSSKGNLFIKGGDEVDYALTIFGKNGVYAWAEDDEGAGVIGVNATQEWGALGYVDENGISFSTYSPFDTYAGNALLTDQFISNGTDIAVFEEGNRDDQTLRIHGRLVVDSCEGCSVLLPPTVWITATPEELMQGDTAVLKWGSTSANSVIIKKGSAGGQPVGCFENGMTASTFGCLVLPQATTRYYAVASNGDVQSQASVNVSVTVAGEEYANGINDLGVTDVEVHPDPQPGRREFYIFCDNFDEPNQADMFVSCHPTFEEVIHPDFAVSSCYYDVLGNPDLPEEIYYDAVNCRDSKVPNHVD